jgi:hypothetical protein
VVVLRRHSEAEVVVLRRHSEAEVVVLRRRPEAEVVGFEHNLMIRPTLTKTELREKLQGCFGSF